VRRKAERGHQRHNISALSRACQNTTLVLEIAAIQNTSLDAACASAARYSVRGPSTISRTIRNTIPHLQSTPVLLILLQPKSICVQDVALGGVQLSCGNGPATSRVGRDCCAESQRGLIPSHCEVVWRKAGLDDGLWVCECCRGIQHCC